MAGEQLLWVGPAVEGSSMPQHDQSPEKPESLQEFAARLKKQDREALAALPPDVAQAEVDRILLPHLWQVANPEELAWPGDLADDLADEDEDDKENV